MHPTLNHSNIFQVLQHLSWEIFKLYSSHSLLLRNRPSTEESIAISPASGPQSVPRQARDQSRVSPASVPRNRTTSQLITTLLRQLSPSSFILIFSPSHNHANHCTHSSSSQQSQHTSITTHIIAFILSQSCNTFFQHFSSLTTS